jgi:PhzF family phenazine biosynthesis protein
MKLKLWQVDAFASKPLQGNPAAIVPLDAWLDDGLMQAIAAENNVAETAFFVRTAPGAYGLRWFAPEREVDLCGHATLASAWALYRLLGETTPQLRFATRSGELVVENRSGGLTMSLPSAPSQPLEAPAGFRESLGASLGAAPAELHISEKGGAGARALLAVWKSAEEVKALRPDAALEQVLLQINCGSLVATAAGGGTPYDMISRFFAPHYGVPEDPVTGSAHCSLTPFWAKRLGKTVLKARQASRRGGDLLCTDAGERTLIAGECALYLSGEIEV